MSKKLKLSIELVPQSSFYSNVRSEVSKSQWKIISDQVRSQSYDICQICEVISNRALDCHEIWHYDDAKRLQKLLGMIALCVECHQVKHIGLAQIKGKGEEALHHFMKINNLKRDKAEKYLQEAFEIWAERSKKEWKLNILHLKEYGIDIKELK